MLKFSKSKYIILVVVAIMVFGTMSNFVNAKEYDWDKLEITYKNFIANPNCKQQQNLLKVLPDQKIETADSEVLDYILTNLSNLEELAKRGDLAAINILFKLNLLTDGAYSEQISIVLGSVISNHPQEFLYALENNFSTVVRVDSLLGNLGTEYVDNVEKSVAELERRYGAIKEVDNVPEQMRNLCLYELGRQIFESRRDIIHLNGNQKMLEN
jgi:hypothetical protein